MMLNIGFANEASDQRIAFQTVSVFQPVSQPSYKISSPQTNKQTKNPPISFNNIVSPLIAIIESKEEILLMRRLYSDLLIVEGDPKSELSLADANIFAADFLVAAVESDYDNLLITITGKGNAVKDFRNGISRFGASHGCARGTVASAKTANK